MARPAVAVTDVLLCLVLVATASFLFPSASAQTPAPAADTCASQTFTINGANRAFSRCSSLPVLGSSLHWTYNPATGTANIAYRAPAPGASGWVAWGINPTARGMQGTQALVAILSGGTATGRTTQVTSRTPGMQQQDLTFPVSGLTVINSDGALVIFATVTLPNNRTTLTHTWQSSTTLANGVPVAHPLSGGNVQSTGSIDLLSGQASGGGSSSTFRRRNVHGVINAVAWGVLMPIGAIIARYVRVFEAADPAWFYLHITCQLSAYVLGFIGFGLGVNLGSDSEGVTYGSHRAMGIALVTLASLQVLALFLRPDKKHKYRVFWNVYHHSVGYTVIVLSFFNILKGFKALNRDDDKYKRAYIGVVIALGALALTLEAVTWVIVINRRRRDRESGKHQQQQQHSNGMYGANRI